MVWTDDMISSLLEYAKEVGIRLAQAVCYRYDRGEDFNADLERLYLISDIIFALEHSNDDVYDDDDYDYLYEMIQSISIQRFKYKRMIRSVQTASSGSSDLYLDIVFDKSTIYRNLEGDNTLDSSSETLIMLIDYGTDADGSYYIVGRVPDIPSFSTYYYLWGIWCPEVTYNPTTAGRRITKIEYLGTYVGSVDTYVSTYKIWTYSALYGISSSHKETAHIFFFCPEPYYFKNSISPVFPRASGSPPSSYWNATTVVGAQATWYNSNTGYVYALATGYSKYASEPKVKHHLFACSVTNNLLSPSNWIDLTYLFGGHTADALAHWYPSGYAGFNTIGSCFPLPDRPGYYGAATAWRDASGNLTNAWITFDENFFCITDVETGKFQTDYTPESGTLWAGGTALIYYNNQYMWVIHDGTSGLSGKRVCLVSDAIDGTYVYDHTVIDMSELPSNSMLLNAIGGLTLFTFRDNLYMLSSGEGDISLSGNYRDHQAFLYRFEPSTKTWKRLGHPFIINNYGYGSETGFNYTLGYDHLGLCNTPILYNNKLYIGIAMCEATDTYQGYMGELDLSLL